VEGVDESQAWCAALGFGSVPHHTRWQGGLHPERTQCTQVSCGTLPAFARLLHLNHVRIRLVLLGWVCRASLVAWVPEVLCAALDSTDAKGSQRARYADRTTGSGQHCPVPFPYAKLFHVLSRFSWQHGMDARGAEGWRLPHARHPCVDLGTFGQNAPSQWEQPALKDTPDHTNRWGYTPWLSMSLGSDRYK
jgi:hypothetical protein